jgi:heme/copper-type cytochrome/quinol oxidase subunit 3
MTLATKAEQITRPEAFLAEHPAGRTVGWWGMVMFVTTEATLFAVLLSSYFYVRFQAEAWPVGGIEEPKLTRPLIMTALLLPSSLPVMWAERGIRHGQRWRLRIGLVATLLMGGAFLALQGMEYSEKLKKFTIDTNVYGSFFYTITGFHGLHVTIGLIMVTWLLAASLRGSFGYRRHERVRLTAIYWHFVDLVWLFILFTIYLSGKL